MKKTESDLRLQIANLLAGLAKLGKENDRLRTMLGIQENNVDDAEKARRAKMFIKLLGLSFKSNGRIDTIWGDKTPLGLYLTMQRILTEPDGTASCGCGSGKRFLECDCTGHAA